MMKSWFLLILVLFPFSMAFGQDLEEEEIRQDFGSIQFFNYMGPHSVMNTREEIIGLGRALGQQMKGQGRALGRYSIQRILDTGIQGMGADVLTLSPQAGVDHIDNLNRIIAGYLEGAFDYPPSTALILADYISRYNAYYRGEWEFFQKQYMPPVLNFLDPQKAGLDVYYYNWPGQTQILIPLRNTLSKGPGGDIDSQELSRSEILQEILQEDNSLDRQKDIINIIEEELAREEQALEDKEREISLREELLQEEEERIAQEQEKVKEDPSLTPEEKEERLEELEREKEQVTEAQEELTKEEEVTSSQRREQEERERRLEEAREEVAREEADPARESIDPASVPQGSVKPLYFLMVSRGSALGQLVLFDLNSKQIMERSALNSIRSRSYQFFGNDVLVLAGRDGAGGVSRLYLLDRRDLSIKTEGQTNVYGESKVLQLGNQIFALLESGSNPIVLGRFNASLELEAQGKQELLGYSLLEVSDGVIYAQGADGRIMGIDPQTLEEIE